jgi:hypothetical protein
MKGAINHLQASDGVKEQLASRLAGYGIPVGFVEDLVAQHDVVTYEKGSFLLLRGAAPADLLFWILSGQQRGSASGQRLNFEALHPASLSVDVVHVANQVTRPG